MFAIGPKRTKLDFSRDGLSANDPKRTSVRPALNLCLTLNRPLFQVYGTTISCLEPREVVKRLQ